jgi:hypothetical protein
MTVLSDLPGACFDAIAQAIVRPPYDTGKPWSLSTSGDAIADAASIAIASKGLAELSISVKRMLSDEDDGGSTPNVPEVIEFVDAMRLCSSLGISSSSPSASSAWPSARRWKFLRACAAELGVEHVGSLFAARDTALRARVHVSQQAKSASPASVRVEGALTRREAESSHRHASGCPSACVDDACALCGAASCAGESISDSRCRHASYERAQGRWTYTCGGCAADPACYVRIGWPDATPGVIAICDACFHFTLRVVDGSGRAIAQPFSKFVCRDLSKIVEDRHLLRYVMHRGAPISFPVTTSAIVDMRCCCQFAADIVSYRTNL